MDLKPSNLSKAASISVPYASQILAGLRTPSLQVALRIYDGTGAQMGPLANLNDAEIAAARKMSAAA